VTFRTDADTDADELVLVRAVRHAAHDHARWRQRDGGAPAHEAPWLGAVRRVERSLAQPREVSDAAEEDVGRRGQYGLSFETRGRLTLRSTPSVVRSAVNAAEVMGPPRSLCKGMLLSSMG
jgi:hypothetical protein